MERNVDPNAQQPPIDNTTWPELPLAEWQSTLDTLHMWMQIVGKIKLTLVPFTNQWWNIALFPTARGLATGVIPYADRSFEIEFDFIEHQLSLRESTGTIKVIPLKPRTVADFYRDLMSALASSDIHVRINPTPVEVPHQIPLDQNEVFGDYDRAYVTRWWRILLGTNRVMQRFQSSFSGKASPLHFFWGSFDFNHTRHSGRLATPPEGVPRFFQLAENEENASFGFWPGNTSASGITYGEPAYFAYTYPEPAGYRTYPIAPEAAHFDERMGLFILRYDDMRRHADPEQALLDFYTSTYAAGADAGGWDRALLEER